MKTALAALVLLALVPLVQTRLDAQRTAYEVDNQLLYLASGEQVRRMVPGFENLVADLYWLRTVQYFGSRLAFGKEKRFELVEPLVEITTALDPRFELAYRYGAVFLAEPAPNGAGQPQAAVRLLERGVERNPHSWHLRQDLGFFHFFFLNDSQQAARILLEASRIPGAPFWFRTSAADFLRRGNERQAARQVWRHVYEDTEGPIRENALFNLQRLDALDAQDAVQQAVDEFRRRTGRAPGDLAELERAGLLRGPARDPSGTPFAYDGEKGRVQLARESRFWRPT